MSTTLIIALLAAIPLIPIFAKILVRQSLRSIGWSLRRRTRKRREIILSRVQAEEERYQSDHRGQPRAEDEDWEKVDGYAAGTARNGALPGAGDWEGVVGFFHPFWSV